MTTNLAFLTMRPRGTVHEHGVGAGDGHVEGADGRLPVLVGDVAAVHAALQRHAGVVGAALRGRVVARAKLELHDVPHGRRHHVGDEHVLRAAHDYGDDAPRRRDGPVLRQRRPGPKAVVDRLGPRARDDEGRGGGDEEREDRLHGAEISLRSPGLKRGGMDNREK